jgi:hypothetical protein
MNGDDEPLSVLYRMQTIQIQVQNRIFSAKTRIKESLREAISKIVHNHVRAVAMKESTKLNLAML